MRRLPAILIVLTVTALFLGACAPKQLFYIFDFVAEQGLGEGEGLWQVSESPDVSYSINGISLNRTTLLSPYRYKGDFTIEIEIFLATMTEGKSEDITFEVCDLINGNGASLYLERQGSAGGEYSLRRYMPHETPTDSPSLPTSLLSNAVNTLKIVKTYGKMEFFLNEDLAPFGIVTGITDSAAAYWALRFNAFDGMDEGLVFHGIRKVTIWYLPGNQAPTGD